MIEQKILTAEKYEELNNKLKQLIQVERPKAIAAIKEAREQGDLSENADYDAAKNYQAEIEAKIKEITNILSYAKILGGKKNNNIASKIIVGSKITLLDLEDENEYTYTIVGEIEANPDKNKISNESPLALALLGKTKNDIVEVKGIKKPYKVKILKVS